MADNIIQFPDPNEYKEEDKGEVMAIIKVFENGSSSTWISEDIETSDQKTWLKACLFSGMYAAHTIIHLGEDGDGPIEYKEIDDDD